MPRTPRLLIILLAGLVVTACTVSTGGDGGTSDAGTPAGPDSSAGSTGGDDPEAAASPRASSNAAGRELSRRPDVVEDLKSAVSTVQAYWAETFRAQGTAFRPVSAVYAYVPGDGTTCGGQPNVPNNAAYCRPDDDISFDVRFTERAYDALGDAFVYYLIGHEYGHAVQRRLGTSLDLTIEYELQADCYAGAYLGDEIRAGALALEDGDLNELRNGLRAVADPKGTPWFDPRAHGTAAQRLDYFGRGFDGSLRACP